MNADQENTHHGDTEARRKTGKNLPQIDAEKRGSENQNQ